MFVIASPPSTLCRMEVKIDREWSTFLKIFEKFFLHRPSGVLELRQRVRPDVAAPLLHRLSGALELPQAGSPFPGGEFSAEPQRGIRRLRTAGATPYPRRWAKRKGHLRFPFLFELLPFPCFLIWRRFPICDRFEIGNGRGFFLPCFS